jgi:hypothetical protein
MPLMPAVLGPNTRLNNFRLGYLPAAVAADRPTHIRVILGGIDIARPDAPTRVLYKSMTIQDRVYDEPNTCAMTLFGAAPTVGAALEVWVNSNAPVLLFNGELQTVEQTYKGRPTTVVHPVTAIDDTARANRRRPLMPFVNVSATTIAQTLMATFAPGFSSAGVEAGLPPVTITFDGSEGGMKGCLTALAKLIGAYWYFELRTLYFFVTPPGGAPDPIDETPGRFLHEPAITWSYDKSQVRTRVYGKGASTQIATTIAANTDLVPVREATMFNPAGGKAIAGLAPEAAASRILTYTGVQLGGGGGLVGPGAAPSAAPVLAPLDGSGMDWGAHGYGYTFVTASGESLVSPASTITVGPVPTPATSVVPGAPTAGGAVDAGSHTYSVTFVTATGETTGAPLSAAVTTIAGSSLPTPAATGAALRGVSGNLAPATTYRYRTTFTTSTGGETLPGAASAAITPVTIAAPTAVLGDPGATPTPQAGPPPQFGTYIYHLSYVSGGYETGLSPAYGHPNVPPGYRDLFFPWITTSPDPRVTGRRLYRTEGGTGYARLIATLDNVSATYTDSTPDASMGPVRAGSGGPIGTAPGDQANIGVPTSTDGRTVGRKIYRSDLGGAYLFLASIGNNTATQYVDNTASVAGQPAAPTTDTSGSTSYRTVPITAIPLGPSNVTARRLYRQFNGVGGIWLVATIANNTATTYTDTIANSALGAHLPATNTAIAGQVRVTVPLGASAVTGRKLYRTASGLTALRLLATLGDNTTTIYTDAALDSVLGAAPPVTDTSSLTQPNGQVPAGVTEIIVANPAAFAAAGGWAVVGNGEQVIRYTGKSANALTGIPPTGPGSLVASVSYNSTITVAPALVGVTGILEQILRGAPVHVWVQRDDTAAQAAMAALDGSGDGVYEHIWSDERRSEPSLIQVCDAQLKLYSRPLVTVTYASRDLKTKSGKTVLIVLSSPAIQASLPIQDVTISELGIKGLLPKFTVTASNARQSFEAILQMLIRKADA